EVQRLAERPPAEPLLWDLEQVAAALNVSPRTVKRMAAAGELPGVVHVSRRRLFHRAAIEDWVARGCPPLLRAKRPRCRRCGAPFTPGEVAQHQDEGHPAVASGLSGAQW